MLLELGAVGSALPIQAALRLVAVHGLTDLWTLRPGKLSPYLLAAVPWPSTTAPFLAASVAHFSRDIGAASSVLLHVSWAMLWVLAGPEVAIATALCYMVIVHLPCHYARVLRRCPDRHWIMPMASVIATALLVPSHVTSLSDWVQRLVCVHVALEEFQHRGLCHETKKSAHWV